MGFFDKLFGKKKDEKKEEKKEDKKEQPKEQKQPQKQAQNKNQPDQSQPQPAFSAITKEENWIYESMLQYLTSPIWKTSIYNFLDQYCLVFDDEEENKFEYFDIHKKFKKMMEELIDGLIQELGVNEDQFSRVLQTGLKHQKHRKYFEQLLIIDNFLVFKKLMIRRNKELELEALKQLQVDDARLAAQGGVVNNNSHQVQQDIKKAEMEREKAELEHALEMSKAIENERKKLIDDEEKQIQDAINKSIEDYKQQQLLKKQMEEQEMLEKQRQQEQQNKPKEQKVQEIHVQKKQQDDGTPTPQSNAQVKPQKINQQVQPKQEEEEEVVVFDEDPQSKIVAQQSQQEQAPSLSQFYKQEQKPSKILPSKLAPIGGSKIANSDDPLKKKGLDEMQVQFDDPIEKRKKEAQEFENHLNQSQYNKEEMQQKLRDIQKAKEDQIPNQEPGKESLDDRKRRLQEQREILRKKKLAERQQEVSDYNSKKDQVVVEQKMEQKVEQKQEQQVDQFAEEQRKKKEELKKRREQLELKKKQAQMQKEQENYEQDLL